MEDERGHIPADGKPSAQNWSALPFDAATNFSLLGWVMDKLIEGGKRQAKIDLRIDDQIRE